MLPHIESRSTSSGLHHRTKQFQNVSSPVDDSLSVEVLEGQDDLGDVEAGRVLQENALPLQVHELQRGSLVKFD